ncbi:MAG: hypothetical protein IPH78_13700 [Bacteroidetes bacterium]|nr:hypothetical protein [Bacteroidota bacterium]
MMKKYVSPLLFLLWSIGIYAQNYTVLGSSATFGGCNCFTVTPDAGNQAGAFFQNNSINLNNSFDYTFNVFLGCNGSGRGRWAHVCAYEQPQRAGKSR